MADIRKFQTHEVLNKVLNTGEDALKVDIDNVTLTTEGGDVAIDVALDKANDTITVFSNTAKDGSGTSYVPLVDSDGHLQVDALSTALPSGAATAANQATIIGHVDGVETLITSSNTKLDTLETTLTAIETDAAAIETLLTGIDADTDAIKTDAAAIEVLITSTNSKIDTFDAVLDNILAKNTEIDTVLDNIKTDTQAIETDMAAIETLLTAANVDHAANEVLLTTIDSDTNDIKTATESSNTHLGNMFYDTALAVTPSDSSDLSGEPYFAVWVGTGGNLKVDMSSGTGTVTLNNCASGQLIPIMVERIYATGTTASNIIVFK
tara:strand:+ start:326 stop:1294 length:969 start_codon:yes stop_codon:yes gene_type:complete